MFLEPLCILLSSSVVSFPVLHFLSCHLSIVVVVSLSSHCLLLLLSHCAPIVVVILLSPLIVSLSPLIVSLSLLIVLLSPVVVSPSSPCHCSLVLRLVDAAAGHCHCHSTCDPPHKQLLMGLEAGGVSGVVIGWLLWGPEAVCSPHNPPYEQKLIGVGWVPCCSVVVFLFFWSWSWYLSSSSLWAPGLFSLFLAGVIIVPGRGLVCCPVVCHPVVLSGTGSHPVSSCSWWWVWVFMWWLCQSLSLFWGCGVVTTQIKPIINEK